MTRRRKVAKNLIFLDLQQPGAAAAAAAAAAEAEEAAAAAAAVAVTAAIVVEGAAERRRAALRDAGTRGEHRSARRAARSQTRWKQPPR